MSNFGMITSGGLVSVTEASTNGTLIDVRYFVPVYDWRIDPYISPISVGTSATEISTVTSPSDTIPTGEIIWNSDSLPYDISDSSTGVALISGSNTQFQEGVSVDLVINPVQLQHQGVNLYTGTPLVDSISAADVIFTPSAANIAWQLSDAEIVNGSNTRPLGTTDDYWSVVEYSSLIGDDGSSCGAFKCRINKDVGSFKFNKIGLYAVKLDNNYEPYGDPFLFAQVIMQKPEIKSSGIGTGGLDEIVLDFQLKLTTEDIDWSVIVYGNQQDYWQKITEDSSLHNSTGVYIGRFAPKDNNTRIAKTIITTWEDHNYGETTDTIEFDKPQLALQNVTSITSGTDLIRTGHFSTFKVDTSGSMVFSLSADNGFYPDATLETYSESDQPKNSMYIPEYTEKFLFGNHFRRWKCIYAGRDGQGRYYTADERFDGYNNSYLGNTDEHNDPKTDLLAMDIHGGGIQIGRSPDDLTRSDTTYGIRMIDRSLYFKSLYFNNNHILGADLKRIDDESLIISTVKPTIDYSDTHVTNGSNIFIVAGALQDKFYDEFNDYSCTREQLYSIVKTSADSFDLGDYFDIGSEAFILANGGINLMNSIRVHSSVDSGSYNYGIIRSKNSNINGRTEKLLMIAGAFNEYSDYSITTRSDADSYTDILNESSILELVAGKQIRFWSDIVPIQSAEDKTNPLSGISNKVVATKRSGFKIGKLLELTSCNVIADNMRFYSYYEQPFARFQNLDLNFALDTNLIHCESASPAIGSNSGYVSDIFKYAKWARIGNMIILKFYLNFKFQPTANANAKLAFRIPSIEVDSQFEKNTDLFTGSENVLTLEIEGTDATQYEEQTGVSEISNTVYPMIYHPIELMFSKDFNSSYNPATEVTEIEQKILVPAYASLNSVGQPSSTNEYGTIPYANPFSTYSCKFSISKSSSLLDLDSLISYLNTNPTGGNTTVFNQVKSSIDYLISAQAKNSWERSLDESTAIEMFDCKFFSWDSFKTQVLANNNISIAASYDKFVAIQLYSGLFSNKSTTWAVRFSPSIFRYDGKGNTYDGFSNIHNNGEMGLELFTNDFMTVINSYRNAIIRLNYSDFGGSNEEVYFRIDSALNPFTDNVSTNDMNNSIGSLYANDTRVYIEMPMLKMWNMQLGVKRRMTFGCFGIGSDTYRINENSTAKTLINNNAW